MKDISILKTLYFNFYYLPFKSALKMPFRVGKKVKINGMGKRSSVQVKDIDKHIRIGMGQSFGMGETTFWSINNEGTLTFGGGQQLVEVHRLSSMEN